ncbi:hypothetical protein [Ottowia testudinis]|uniref:Uncharacterized protein n=1 Tax=Ottowia testudinis TaxID=2816950 RepID=A0A975H1Z5_9BURK|nr:hypothetical protein [Ottowia testudinis]QTD44343.1 hypothetical protein J1M35_14665 [Ottowia testudinis]
MIQFVALGLAFALMGSAAFYLASPHQCWHRNAWAASTTRLVGGALLALALMALLQVFSAVVAVFVWSIWLMLLLLLNPYLAVGLHIWREARSG